MSKRSFDDEWAMRLEQEPGYQGRPRPIIPLSYGGAVKEYIERRAFTQRCSTCSIMCDGERCATCTVRDARNCECGSFVYADEAACTECGEMRAA